MIICGTGHRPEDCSEGEGAIRLKVKIKLESVLDQVEHVITGMASGFDLWYADEALNLNLPLVAARPWAGHKPRKGDEKLYQSVLDRATKIVDVDPSENYPGVWVYPKRNHWMVDNATHLIAYWSGKESGGTYECWSYADKKVLRSNIFYDPPF